MTSKEALEILRGCIAEFRVTGNSKITHDEVINAKYELDELVERDTPMKVEYDDMDNRCCPICEEVQLPNVYATNNEFCPYCGQRLDWSE